MEKNKLLKVSSILLIVFGVLVALGGIIFLAAAELVAEVIGSTGQDIGIEGDAATVAAAAKMMVIILGVAMLILAVGYIAAGVVGVKQKSAKTCFIVAIVLIVLCGISAIMNIAEGSIFPAIISLIVPVLYLVGAIQLKKAAADEQLQANDATNNDQPM